MEQENTEWLRGTTLIGSGIAFALCGLAYCQSVRYFYWYYEQTDVVLEKKIAMLVAFLTIATTAHFLFICFTVHYYLIRRGLGIEENLFKYCFYWTMLGYDLTTFFCCVPVEIFYVHRLYKFLGRAKATMILYIPFAVGWGFSLTYIGKNVIYQIKCLASPDTIGKRKFFWILASYASRATGDMLIGIIMSWLLRQKSSELKTRSNMSKVTRSLSNWALTSGMTLTVTSIALLISFSLAPHTNFPQAILFIRAPVYVNTLLSLLNSRPKYLSIINETIPLHEEPDLNSTHRRETDTLSMNFNMIMVAS